MAKSYIGLVEYSDGERHQKIFTSQREQKTYPKLMAAADQWIAKVLRDHGTQNVRCIIAEVKFYITG